MFVAWDAQDPLLMASFLGNKDVHRVRACIIFRDWRSSNLPPDDLLASIKETCPACQEKGIFKCNHSERYIAKQSGHAFTYKMGIRKFIRLRREEGLFISESKAREIQACCISQQIAAWQNLVEKELRQSPWLETPLGRKREFYGVLDDDMIRAALSWKAQATVSQITNRAIIQLHDLFQTYPDPRPRIVTQTHDSALITHHPSHTELIHADMTKAFTCPINIHNNILNIPLELSTGPNWGELK
jgi:DNA polymerase I-like protein with 3'-5' exonuclease and polymerase domains